MADDMGTVVAQPEAKSEVSVQPKKRITVELIIKCVCDHFELTREQLLEPTHRPAIARPRQVAMYLSTVMTRRSLPDLARRFGGKHHTTILWGRDRIEKLLPTDETLREQVRVIKLAIDELAPIIPPPQPVEVDEFADL